MDRRRDSAKARDGVAPFNSRGKRSRSSPHHARARNPKPLVLAAFFGYFLSLVTESTPPEAFTGTRGALEGIPQPRLFRGLGDGSYGLPRALRALAMTRVLQGVGLSGRTEASAPTAVHFCRAGPVCPAGSAGKESPSHGFAVTAPFRQGGLEERGGGLPRALRALAMTRVFARSAGALLMVRWVGNRKGRPSGKGG